MKDFCAGVFVSFEFLCWHSLQSSIFFSYSFFLVLKNSKTTIKLITVNQTNDTTKKLILKWELNSNSDTH